MTELFVDSVTWRLTGFNSPYVTLFQIGILAPGLIITFTCLNLYRDRFSILVWSFCIFCLISVLMNYTSSNSRSIIASLFNIFIIPIGISFGKYLSDNILLQKNSYIYIYSLQIPAIAVGTILVTWGTKFDSDCGFAFFLFFPFLFFLKGKYKQVLMLFLYGLVVLLAGKRSIFLAYSLCVVIYFLYLTTTKKSKNENFNRILLLFVFGVGVYFVISNYYENLNYIFDRFANIQEDKGSGREDVYASIIEGVNRSDFLHQLLGHGYFSAVETFTIGAHNDLLEITYDYGVIALSIYVMFMFKLILFSAKEFIKKRKQSIYPNILIMNTLIIIVLGMLNCMIVSTVFEFTNFCALGMTLRAIQLDLR